METIQEIPNGRPPDLLQQVLRMDREWRSGQLQLSPEDIAALEILRGSNIGQSLVAATTELKI